MTLAAPCPSGPAAESGTIPWWRAPVVYQVYLRSFADSNGDGIGDLPGLTARLPYLAALGVDALWLTPHYPHGGADGGYDVADYTSVDPDYGTVQDVAALVAAAHEHGLKVLLDIVPNHTSDDHPWFTAALADPGCAEANRYHFITGGDQPPNNWQSLFGGPAWSQTPDGRWYLHLFAPEQPDLNWHDASVAAHFEDVLRFWLDLGVDGFRVDVAYGLFKDPDLRDNPGVYSPTLFGHGPEQAMTWDQEPVHDVWRSWRALVDSYPGDRMLVGEVCLADPDRVAAYTRPDEMHQAFAFRILKSGWDAHAWTEAITEALCAFGKVGSPVSWVLGNHDKDRQVTRFGGGQQGLHRARAAALLLLCLPGAAYLYAGDELGLPQAHVPDEHKQDPIFFRTAGARTGRDGCRIPMPWEPHTGHGFSPADAAAPWLPFPQAWGQHAVTVQEGDPSSVLWLYRAALAARREHPAIGSGESAHLVRHGDLIEVRLTGGGQSAKCWLNMGDHPVSVPAHGTVLVTSDPRVNHSGTWLSLPSNSAAWVALN